ncbi:TRAP transporter small permease [Acuticoccus sediminis]|nr:TRAP transporter small permease subunit [Acuticoccus sediminis]
MMMAAIFVVFILQIAVRYIVGSAWFAATFGDVVDASSFGWTLEFIMVLWLWTIFFGNAFVVRERDHVSFDILYFAVGPQVRRVFVVVGALAIMAALWLSIEPTYGKMRILKIKSSATLPVKMLPIYSIYFLFLAVVGLRYGWRAYEAIRHGVDREPHHHLEITDE